MLPSEIIAQQQQYRAHLAQSLAQEDAMKRRVRRMIVHGTDAVRSQTKRVKMKARMRVQRMRTKTKKRRVREFNKRTRGRTQMTRQFQMKRQAQNTQIQQRRNRR